MLQITYQVRPRTGGEPAATGTIFEHPSATPDWFLNLRESDRHDPIDIWTSIQGDRNHILRIVGAVNLWNADAEMLDLILTPEAKTVLSRYPLEQYEWVVRAEARDHDRRPRSDPEYQAALEATFSDPRYREKLEAILSDE